MRSLQLGWLDVTDCPTVWTAAGRYFRAKEWRSAGQGHLPLGTPLPSLQELSRSVSNEHARVGHDFHDLRKTCESSA